MVREWTVDNLVEATQLFLKLFPVFTIKQIHGCGLVTLRIWIKSKTGRHVGEVQTYHVALVPKTVSERLLVKAEIAQPIEYRLSVIDFVAGIAMLVVIDYSVSSRVNKESVGFHHTKRRQLEVLVAAVYDDFGCETVSVCLMASNAFSASKPRKPFLYSIFDKI